MDVVKDLLEFFDKRSLVSLSLSETVSLFERGTHFFITSLMLKHVAFRKTR